MSQFHPPSPIKSCTEADEEKSTPTKLYLPTKHIIYQTYRIKAGKFKAKNYRILRFFDTSILQDMNDRQVLCELGQVIIDYY